ncbi:flagellar hook-basal body complex protein FliE [Clostridium polynesiense]|uniref:flagellar hook-basal body complex protein FliE n=1 Tax=Clostridium polynesiense TaxID=1325933 RepID=UPI00058F35B1|nr:flagellar hook-basal body complex protein FliE [Clostridium polynesiense]
MKINNFVPDMKIFQNIDKDEKQKTLNFGDTLREKLNEVNNHQITAEKATESFIKGEDISIHQVMLTTEEAKLSLQLAVQVRNKLVEAYQEINRLQL